MCQEIKIRLRELNKGILQKMVSRNLFASFHYLFEGHSSNGEGRGGLAVAFGQDDFQKQRLHLRLWHSKTGSECGGDQIKESIAM